MSQPHAGADAANGPHRIVHGYEKVDHDVIRGLIEIHLPELLRQIDRILGPSDEADGPQRPPS